MWPNKCPMGPAPDVSDFSANENEHDSDQFGASSARNDLTSRLTSGQTVETSGHTTSSIQTDRQFDQMQLQDLEDTSSSHSSDTSGDLALSVAEMHISPRIRPSERVNHNDDVGRSIRSGEKKVKWYIEDVVPLPQDDPDYLCPTCRHIDLHFLFFESESRAIFEPEEYICLGDFAEIAAEDACALCRLVATTVRLRVELSLHHKVAKLNDDPLRLLAAEWYLSPATYNSAERSYAQGYQLFLRHDVFEQDQLDDIMHTTASHPFALRLIVAEARGGRRIPADHLDFSWIRETLELCEISTEMPERRFIRQLRVIDTSEMCVVDLEHNERYVALSYPWGEVEQVRLVSQNEAFMRKPGALLEMFEQLPRTIQDALVVVIGVGTRYLWLDSLCILQDDSEDVEQQLMQMGEIYIHAHFTIFAISGTDANYGLPGVWRQSRKLQQVVEEVDDLCIANSQPYLESIDLVSDGSWGSRGWTFQERFMSQRGLFIGDGGVLINCSHTHTPEDEHCFHVLERDEKKITRGDTCFFAGMDPQCEPFIGSGTPFDSFAQYVYEYTQRTLTLQSDALSAFLGILAYLKRGEYHEGFLYGIPKEEFDAGLLWTPLGHSVRREGFPSWSWLGWTGGAAWPWTHERDTFLSTKTMPLRWLGAGIAEGQEKTSENDEGQHLWYSYEDLCMPKSVDSEEKVERLRKSSNDHLGVLMRGNQLRSRADSKSAPNLQWIFWPDGKQPKLNFSTPDASGRTDRCITFSTLSAHFYVVGEPFRRRKLYNMRHSIWRRAVCDEFGNIVGYIEVPDPDDTAETERIQTGSWEFVAMSRSTVDGKREAGHGDIQERIVQTTPSPPVQYGSEVVEVIEKLRSIRSSSEQINEKGHFDTTVHDEHKSWCMFNVLMLTYQPKVNPESHTAGVAYRAAVGRIHIDAFMLHQPVMKVVQLG